MIDLHNHILPLLDDGARDWDESVAMCKSALRDGITTIVATPHIKPNLYVPSRELILSRVKELNMQIKNRNWKIEGAVFPNAHNLTILPGADVSLSTDLIMKIKESTILFIGENDKGKNPRNTLPSKRYLLLELPDYFLFPKIKDLILELHKHQIIPILTHPERNMMIQGNIHILYELIKTGSLSQITAMSIIGGFGKRIKKFAKILLSHNLVHIIASDAHSQDKRPPTLSFAVEETAKIVGKERALMMVKAVPEKIIKAQEVEIPKPLLPKNSFFSNLTFLKNQRSFSI